MKSRVETSRLVCASMLGGETTFVGTWYVVIPGMSFESWVFTLHAATWKPEYRPGAQPSPPPLLPSRCGWMLPHRSSSLLVLALGSYWLSLATTNSTTTVTSEYLPPTPSKAWKWGEHKSQLARRKGIELMASSLAGLRCVTDPWPVPSWPEHPLGSKPHPDHSEIERSPRPLPFFKSLYIKKKNNNKEMPKQVYKNCNIY